jgi:preprotein translocase subunit SecY
MNSVETTVVAVAAAAMLTIVALVVLFALFHRKIDQLYTALAERIHEVEQTIDGQREKIAVIHHVATSPPTPAMVSAPAAAPAAAAPPSGKN